MHGLNTFKNLKPNNLIDRLLFEVNLGLENFDKSIEYLKILNSKKNEDQISEAFCVYMTFNGNRKFCFTRESSQKSNRSVDIGVYFKGGVYIFSIEAKILPTPISNGREEFEYVYGQGGGIQRFKEEFHGFNSSTQELLTHNGMFGYIKRENYQYWIRMINKWVNDAGWSTDEQLCEIDLESKVGRLESCHLRTRGTSVTLYHFWILVN